MFDTDDPLLGTEAQRRARTRRNAAVIAGTLILAAIMGVGLLDAVRVVDAFGVESQRVRTTESGTVLEVEYPNVTRPGLASPFEITIEQQGGFGDEIEVSINREYFGLWDFNGVVPAPMEETGDAEVVVWTFAAPDTEVFRMSFDARIEPARQRGASGRVAVLTPDGIETAAVEFTTNIRP